MFCKFVLGNSTSDTLLKVTCVLLCLLSFGYSNDNQFLCELDPPTDDFNQPPEIRYYFNDPDCLPFNFTGEPHLPGSTFDTYEDCEKYCIYGHTDPPPGILLPTDPPTDSPAQPPFETDNICLKNYDPGTDNFFPPFEQIRRYYFNRTTLVCEYFLYRGNDGNENNFESIEQCMERCGYLRSVSFTSSVSTSVHILGPTIAAVSSSPGILLSESSMITTSTQRMAISHTTDADSPYSMFPIPILTKSNSPTVHLSATTTTTIATLTMATPSDSITAHQVHNPDSRLSVAAIYSILIGCFVLTVLIVVIIGLLLCVAIRHHRIMAVNVYTERNNNNELSKHWVHINVPASSGSNTTATTVPAVAVPATTTSLTTKGIEIPHTSSESSNCTTNSSDDHHSGSYDHAATTV